MGIIVKQSVAIDVALGPFVDSTDGNTVESALTITQPDIRLSKNGAAFAQKSAAQTAAHMENGYYSVNLSTTDTNTVGSLRVHCHESGALPVWEEFQVVEEAIYDAFYAASATGLIPVNVTQFGGSAGTFASGRPEVNTSHAAGTAWASGAITSAVFAADAITAAKLHSDVTTELQSGLATAAALTTVDDFLDTEIAAIKAKTDSLTFTVAGQVDANIESVNAVTVVGDGAGTPWGP